MKKPAMNKQQQSNGIITLRTPKANDARSVTRTIRTFMVDDSPFVLVLLARILAKDERITIVGSAADGTKAFHYASLSNPDLVLMDLHMPGLDGAEATRWLKQLRTPPVVFIVTSDDSRPARIRCLDAGADAFLVKSEDLPVQLQEAIQKFFSDDCRERKMSGINK
jgi:DNA-binding NarL/FixJ family response regulator